MPLDRFRLAKHLLLSLGVMVWTSKMAFGQTASLDQQASAFLSNFWAGWSEENAKALPFIQGFISDPIEFYGKSITLSSYMKNETAFAARWPQRLYTLEPNSLFTKCDTEALTCNLSGIVDWTVDSPARNARSTGRAHFTFDISAKGSPGNYAFTIVAQTGSVISRNLSTETPSDSTQATGAISQNQPPNSSVAVPTSPEINSGSDWWVIDQTTFTCIDLTSSNYPFQSPLQFIAWAREHGDLTSVTKEPNDPGGKWIEITDTPQIGQIRTVDFFQPEGNCDAVLAYQQQQGVLPNPNDLK